MSDIFKVNKKDTRTTLYICSGLLAFALLDFYVLITNVQNISNLIGWEDYSIICIVCTLGLNIILQKQPFLEISQNSQENTCSRVSFLISIMNILVNDCILVIINIV